MKDQIAVVWNRLGMQPTKMGTLLVTDSQSRFTYEEDYVESGMRGLGLVYAPENFDTTIVRNRDEFFDLIPPLQALIPPRSERNFQRALVLKYLARLGIEPARGFESDWSILLHAGHGAIGHLDVFDSDEKALEWYATPSKKGLIELDDDFGFSLKEFMTWFDGDTDHLLDLLGPTPTVGGAIPKLPLSIASTGWDGRIGLPTRFGDSSRTDIILKLENSAQYPGIIELEQLSLEVHREAGFDVPRFWPVRVRGLNAIAIERFDRTGNGGTAFMESVYSVLASGSNKITHHYSTTYEHIIDAIDNPYVTIVEDRQAAREHLLDRLLLAMLTGNGDLHLENLAFIEDRGEIKFSPVYDPTPMRAYSIHDALFPPGMSLGGYGDIDDSGDIIGFENALDNFSRKIGMNRAGLSQRIEKMMTVTDSYSDRVMSMTTLPEVNRTNLVSIHQDMRKRLGRFH